MTALGDLSWPEAERLAAAGAMLAVPVGSTEQHGPHLPLSTDTDVAVALAARLAARRGDVVVAPPVGYGSSGEHAGFAGTLSIGQEALELMLLELGRSAAGTFGQILVVCAHGGNREPAARAVARLCAESTDALLWMTGGVLAGGTGSGDAGAGARSDGAGAGISPACMPGGWRGRRQPPRRSIGVAVAIRSLRLNGRRPVSGSRLPVAPADAHAGRTETAIQLALDPGRVRMALAEPGNPAPVAELMPLLRAAGVRAASRNGVLGDPAGASATEGAALLEALTADLLSTVAGWRRPVPR